MKVPKWDAASSHSLYGRERGQRCKLVARYYHWTSANRRGSKGELARFHTKGPNACVIDGLGLESGLRLVSRR